jgi:peptidoglycan/xylan/chitin deacetylase (PgdA/CDA1 family)
MHDKRLIEIMQKNGLKGTFNINSGLLPKESGWKLCPAEAVEVYTGSGMEVATHGHKHLSLTNVDSAIAVNDIIQDRIALEGLFGRIIKGLAYANGLYDDESVKILQMCGIEYARTVVSTEKFELPTDWLRWHPTCHHNNRKLMDLVEAFLADQPDPQRLHKYTPKLFYLWGHAFEFQRRQNWEHLEELCQKLSGREDVWYATNIEIHDYVEAYRQLRYSADGSTVYNPTLYDIWFDIDKKLYCIKPGETLTIGE